MGVLGQEDVKLGLEGDMMMLRVGIEMGMDQVGLVELMAGCHQRIGGA